jgi:hypothetical protein
MASALKFSSLSTETTAVIGGTVAGVAASAGSWGIALGAIIGVVALAAAGATFLLSFIVVSSGVTFTFFTDGQRSILPGLGGATVEGLRLGGVLGAFSVALLAGRLKLKDVRGLRPYLVFLFIAAASILWSPDRGMGLRLLSRLAYPVAVFAVCSAVAGVHGDGLFRKLFCWSAVVATVTNGLLAAREISNIGLVEYGLRYHGSSGPMDFGLFCAAGGLTLYTMWSRYHHRVYLILAIVLAIQLVATGTRTSMIAGIGGLVLIQMLEGRRVGALSVLLIGLAIWMLIPTLGARTTQGGVGTEWLAAPGGGRLNLSGRAVIWDDVWNGLIGDARVLGNGLGATQKFLSSRYVLPHDVHNAYLLILADTGILGLAAYLFFLVATALELMRKITLHSLGTNYSALSLGLLLLLALSGLVQNPLYVYGAAPMFLFAALALSRGYSTAEDRPRIGALQGG